MNGHLVELRKSKNEVAIVTMKRQEKRNALSLQLMEELISAFESFSVHTPYRVVILTGEGPAFSAGLDLQESSDPTLIEKMAQHVAHLLKAIYTCPIVTIAAVQGDAIAGGAGLVAACDYALVAKGAKMGFPEVRRGLIAAQVSTLLCRQMKLRDIRELLLFGELVSSEQSVKIGLANKEVEPTVLMNEALNAADKILLGAPGAVRGTKLLIDKLHPANFFEDLQTALSLHQSVRHSEEAKEGIQAFLEKRPPVWHKP